jgi:HPt (histidine-containing phosphotransfer) domain-containing protein
MCAEVSTRNADSECALDEQVLAQLYQLRRPERPDPVPKFLTSFLEGAEGYAGTIRAAMAQQDATALFQAAHALKSSSAMIGAMALSNLAIEFEQMGRNDKLIGVQEHLKRFESIYEATVQAVRDLLRREAA